MGHVIVDDTRMRSRRRWASHLYKRLLGMARRKLDIPRLIHFISGFVGKNDVVGCLNVVWFGVSKVSEANLRSILIMAGAFVSKRRSVDCSRLVAVSCAGC